MYAFLVLSTGRDAQAINYKVCYLSHSAGQASKAPSPWMNASGPT